MTVLLAHPGTQYSHQLARQLARHNALYEFWTGFALAREARATEVLQSLLPAGLKKSIANRLTLGIPANLIRTLPRVELKALRQLRRGEPSQEVFHERNRVFQQNIPLKAIQQATAIIGFDTSSWLLAEKAEKYGKPFFLDQSIAHPLAKEPVLQDVARRFPDWHEDIEERMPEVLRCENREHELATKVVVASSFTMQTLVAQGIPADKIIVNPYGVDLEKFYPSTDHRAHRPLRFLFLGAISARKGVPLLLEAWRALNLKNAELWLVGPLSDNKLLLLPDLPGLECKGKVAHQELPALLKQCDVLVFPSYFEGFGLVLLEALASGLPIISTEATAAPDLIKNGVEGFITPSGNIGELCRAMKFFMDEPEQLKAMSDAARRCAENYSWDRYGDRWLQILGAVV